MFNKSTELFPVKKSRIYLSHCSIAPFYSRGYLQEKKLAKEHMESGVSAFSHYESFLNDLRAAAARLLDTSFENLALVKNTSEAMGLIANGYPFEEGDQVVGYVHEYPANHYPWKLQEKRGVELVLLPNCEHPGQAARGLPCSWSMADLEERVTGRTKIVAISHVQFTSGFAADLEKLGRFCKSRGIDLIVDAAQSLGCLPLYPEKCHISAVASSGWKWLMGPVGTGLLYTSAEFRRKIDHVMVGAELMLQGTDYLDHTWQPHHSARRFEYSTSPITLAAALRACIEDIPLRYGLENISAEVFRLQNIMLAHVNRDRFTPVVFPLENRSGILSLMCRHDPSIIARKLEEKGVVCSARGGYLRVAPHFYNSDEELLQATDWLNFLGE
ncbi:aminotransferase class V-fold PLP-dependent enzyme [Desulfoferrobacter suflitae]|uniref:aminotransferase class V-fold PLP-dependent enzyme n=1 Tax=Desulfoferrobacter suflitae TaxID=2865782 RepID=UPI0021640A69|nr:aminotransferase class V-fold PLP-dependent enzyme [Desulfoferrobacter suflitae]MCK8603519.1 aminotransferase class V-fold PLP-dependent enzyme [Desulfoferrobacter suflitae]